MSDPVVWPTGSNGLPTDPMDPTSYCKKLHTQQRLKFNLLLILDYDPNVYTFFGYMGITSALVFCNMGAAFGTGYSGIGICQVGMYRTDMIFKSLIPIIMAGILGIYGLIVSVIIQAKSKSQIIPLISFNSPNHKLR